MLCLMNAIINEIDLHLSENSFKVSPTPEFQCNIMWDQTDFLKIHALLYVSGTVKIHLDLSTTYVTASLRWITYAVFLIWKSHWIKCVNV